MIEVWTAGDISTDNPIFFKLKENQKAYLLYQGQKTEIPVKKYKDFWQGEFRVSLAGDYKLIVGSEQRSLSVKEYERLSFYNELLFTVVAVALFFLVLAFKNRRKYVPK